MVVALNDDLALALDGVAFARAAGVDPDPWQVDLLRGGHDRVLLNCSRQSGKSTMASLVALHRALYCPGSLVLILAPALRQSQELFSKLGAFYGALGEPHRAYSERRLSLELTNGSRIVSLPGTEKTIRGYSGAGLLILDEAARIPDELYYAVRPMLAVSQGRLMMLSTPFGKRGIFHEEWTTGRGWKRFEVPARECPRIPASFLQEERRTLGEWWYKQEYECVFGENIDAVFRHEDIQAAITDEFEPLFPGGIAR